MSIDLLGESTLLCLGFARGRGGTYTFENLVAKSDQDAWMLGRREKPTVLQAPLHAEDLVAFCHQCLREEEDETLIQSVQHLLPKAILLRQTLRLATSTAYAG